MLREAREIRDMLASPGWKAYERIVREQLAIRFEQVMKPGHDFSQTQTVPGPTGPEVRITPLDGMSRYGAIENIKGAYIGLRLALSLPTSILQEADRLRDTSPTEGEGQ